MIFYRFCKDDEICEEMVAFLILPDSTTGAKICKTETNKFPPHQIDISTAVSITTDGTPSMTGEKAGFVNPSTTEAGHTVIGFHFIIHEEALCTEAGLKALQEVMPTVAKFLDCISALKTISGFTDGGGVCV